MTQMEGVAMQAEWAAKNIAYNLDFIPADKLDWKPAPTASSALEIVGHLVGVLRSMTDVLRGGAMQQPDMTPPKSLDEAKSALLGATQEYADVVRALTPEELNRKVQMRFGTPPLSFVAVMPSTDLLHHHGQIAYIQMLLGDAEPHFDMSLLPTE